MEPLAASVRSNPQISGISVDSEEFQIGLYADDVPLSLSNSLVSLPAVQHILETLGSFSLYKTNYSKSSMVNINLDSTLKTQISNLTPFLYWEQLLPFSILLRQWYLSLQIPLKHSKCISHWYSLHKIFYKWYYTLTRLASIFPDHSPNCWQQCGHHIWWDCPIISTYWSEVSGFMASMAHTSVPPPLYSHLCTTPLV